MKTISSWSYDLPPDGVTIHTHVYTTLNRVRFGTVEFDTFQYNRNISKTVPGLGNGRFKYSPNVWRNLYDRFNRIIQQP